MGESIDGNRSAATMLGGAEIRALAARLELTPAKRWGQNFVVDANTVRRIVRTADVPGLDVVEVGPGLGSLTLGLTEVGARVAAVEIDARLAELLPETVARKQPQARLEVVQHDALTLESLPFPPQAIVANLPYNVSVPVLIHLLERFDSIERALVMVQAEVGHRLAAKPGSKTYGSPSAKVAWWGAWALEGEVSRQIFWPVPNVDSVLVGFRRGPSRGDEALRRRTFRVIDGAFGQRRKMLRQALAGVYGSSAAATAVLEAAGVDPTLRGEALELDDFIRIAEAGAAGIDASVPLSADAPAAGADASAAAMMEDRMVERTSGNVGSAAIQAATGRTHEQWRDLLEAAGALGWAHRATADWLMAEHGVSPWWAQGITVDFEQDRKGRLPGQRADGTFAVTRTRTLPGERLAALAAVRAAVEARHGGAHGENLAAAQPVVRWRLVDGTRLAAAAQQPNRSGTPVSITIERLADADAMAAAKGEIDAIFATTG